MFKFILVCLIFNLASSFFGGSKTPSGTIDFTVCDGWEDDLGLKEISADPKALIPGKTITMTLDGVSQRDLEDPVCVMSMMVAGQAQEVTVDFCDYVQCPVESGEEWSVSYSEKVPSAAVALAGSSIDVHMECTDGGEPLACSDSSMKIKLRAIEEETARAEQSAGAKTVEEEQEEFFIDFSTPQALVGLSVGFCLLGFCLTGCIMYTRQNYSRKVTLQNRDLSSRIIQDLNMEAPDLYLHP